MQKSHLKLVARRTVNRTVTPKRLPNADLRTREHPTEAEMERLLRAAKENRWGNRDATMLLVAYRHGLRASELVDLRWDQVDFRTATCTFTGSNRAHPARIQSSGMSCERCGGCNASRSPRAHLCSPRSVERPLAAQGSPRWSSALVKRPSSPLRPTRTCCGTRVGTPWPTGGTIRGRFRRTSATRTFSTPCGIRNCRPLGSRTFGGSSQALME